MQVQFGEAFQGEEHQSFTLAGDNHAAIMVHGFPGTPNEMRPAAEVLHEAGWTVHAPLLPGFGSDIDSLPDRTHQDWIAAVEQVYLEYKQRYDFVMLCGLSMGGALSMYLAAKHQPDALMLFAPFWQIEHILWKALPVIKFVLPRFKPFRLFEPDFTDPNVRESIQRFMPEADLDDPEIRAGIKDFAIPVRMMDHVRILGDLGYKAAPHLTMPTLVVQGLQDELVLPAKTKKLMTRFGATPDYKEVPAEHELLTTNGVGWPTIRSLILDFAAQQRTGA